jgi:hypothetical protein
LGDFFGILVIAGDVAGQAENPAFVPSDQLLDCSSTSVTGPGHKLRFIGAIDNLRWQMGCSHCRAPRKFG